LYKTFVSGGMAIFGTYLEFTWKFLTNR